MTCRLDECNQGRKPCPNPCACSDSHPTTEEALRSDAGGYEAGYLPLQFVGAEPEQTKPLVINWQKLAIFCAVLLVILWALIWPH